MKPKLDHIGIAYATLNQPERALDELRRVRDALGVSFTLYGCYRWLRPGVPARPHPRPVRHRREHRRHRPFVGHGQRYVPCKAAGFGRKARGFRFAREPFEMRHLRKVGIDQIEVGNCAAIEVKISSDMPLPTPFSVTSGFWITS